MPAVTKTLLIVVMFLLSGGTAAATNKPNVIFIMADDLGYGDLGCYGQKTIKTPNIDRLAEQGTRFTQFYAGSTVCAPSRCVLMTGLHSGHAYIRGNKTVPLRPEDVTVAEVFKQAGYVTGIIGKWGLGEAGSVGVPNKQGFDYWFGYLNQVRAHNYYPEMLWRNEMPYVLPGNLNGGREQWTHNLMTGEALTFIERYRKQPFFLYLPYTVPHANNELARDTNINGMGGDGMEVPSYGQYADKDWPSPQKGHAAMISRLDGDVGRIMAKLKELELNDNTLVLFTSDNGPHHEGGAKVEFFDSNGPLRGSKRDLFDGGVRVPMIAYWPGKVVANKTSDHVWAMWDFLPTMADLIGADTPEGLDGLSMLEAVRGGESPEHDILYWEFHEGGFKQAIRAGDYKAIRHNNNPVELYHLPTDIGEEKNIAGEHPALAARMAKQMDDSRTESKHWPVRIRR